MYYPHITLLITHYNRSKSLERLLRSFHSLNVTFGEVVVSDDASSPVHTEHIKQLQQQYDFRLLEAGTNKGLWDNLNKGHRAVKTPYTLYVQEDFTPTAAFVATLGQSEMLMENDKDLDLVRYFAHYRYPYLKPYANGFEEVSIPLLATDYTKIYSYADTPHLKRSTFLKKFGPYTDEVNSDRTEYQMCLSFLAKGGKCIIHQDFKTLFIHENLQDEPSTLVRPSYQQKASAWLDTVKHTYRQARYNFDLMKKRTEVMLNRMSQGGVL